MLTEPNNQRVWCSVMGSTDLVYDGGKIYRRVVGMGKNQNKFFCWILMVVMVQCFGFTGVCVWWGNGLWKGGGKGRELGWIFHWILTAVMVQCYGFIGVCVWWREGLQGCGREELRARVRRCKLSIRISYSYLLV